MMKNILVAYFSATGTTAELAEKLAKVTGAKLHEIKPQQPYTSSDLDWMNKKSRSSVEMNDKSFRPAIANQVEDMTQYDTIFLTYPGGRCIRRRGPENRSSPSGSGRYRYRPAARQGG